jgi:hypothetical protein
VGFGKLNYYLHLADQILENGKPARSQKGQLVHPEN